MTQRHLVRQARRCEGGFLVGRSSRLSTGCALKALETDWGQPDPCENVRWSEEQQYLGATTSPPTGNTYHLSLCGSCGPRSPDSKSGVLSATHGRPPTTVQGRPCCFCGCWKVCPASFLQCAFHQLYSQYVRLRAALATALPDAMVTNQAGVMVSSEGKNRVEFR